MRRGLGSCSTPLSANKPPPLTIVASTLSYSFQRSMPPCASITWASSPFIRYLHQEFASSRKQNRSAILGELLSMQTGTPSPERALHTAPRPHHRGDFRAQDG